jgi:hypothetical protein
MVIYVTLRKDFPPICTLGRLAPKTGLSYAGPEPAVRIGARSPAASRTARQSAGFCSATTDLHCLGWFIHASSLSLAVAREQGGVPQTLSAPAEAGRK